MSNELKQNDLIMKLRDRIKKLEKDVSELKIQLGQNVKLIQKHETRIYSLENEGVK